MPTEFEMQGLPEYFVDTFSIEPVDETGLIRVFCGAKKKGVVVWLYSAIVNAESYLTMRQNLTRVAADSWNAAEVRHFKKMGH